MEAKVDIDLNWLPFQLDPTLPAAGVDKLQHYVNKFGPGARQMLMDPNNRLNQRGRPMGLEFVYHEGSRVFNSKLAHRLLHYARHNGGGGEAQNRLQEVLFRRYFNEGANLGTVDALVDAAEEAALSPNEVRTYLTSKQDEAIVDAALVASHQSCSGVPFFTFPSGKTVSGGEAIDVFKSILLKERARTSASQ